MVNGNDNENDNETIDTPLGKVFPSRNAAQIDADHLRFNWQLRGGTGTAINQFGEIFSPINSSIIAARGVARSCKRFFLLLRLLRAIGKIDTFQRA